MTFKLPAIFRRNRQPQAPQTPAPQPATAVVESPISRAINPPLAVRPSEMMRETLFERAAVVPERKPAAKPKPAPAVAAKPAPSARKDRLAKRQVLDIRKSAAAGEPVESIALRHDRDAAIIRDVASHATYQAYGGPKTSRKKLQQLAKANPCFEAPEPVADAALSVQIPIASVVERQAGPASERHEDVFLTDGQVMEIRLLLASGERQQDVAEAFGICASSVSRIGRHSIYKWAGGPKIERGVVTHENGRREVLPKTPRISRKEGRNGVGENVLVDPLTRRIMRDVASVGIPYVRLAKVYEVADTTVSRVVRRRDYYANLADDIPSDVSDSLRKFHKDYMSHLLLNGSKEAVVQYNKDFNIYSSHEGWGK